MKKNNKSYDFTKKNKAGISASMRALVAIYLGYMAWNLVKTAGAPDNTLPTWVAWLVAVVFAAVAVAFGYYAWKRYQNDLEDAELTEEELAELEPESSEELPRGEEADEFALEDSEDDGEDPK